MPDRQPSAFEVLTHPLRSIPFLLARPRLLGLAISPIILNLFVFTLVISLGFHFVTAPLADRITVGTGIVQDITRWFVLVTLTLLLLFLSALISFLLIVPLGAPFNDLISEKIEEELLRDAPELRAPSSSLMKGIRNSLREAFRRISYQLPILIFIFMVGFVPLIGPLLAACLAFLNAMLMLPLDAYSYSLDRRGFNFHAKRTFLAENTRLWRPFGFGLAIMMLIPCNIIWFHPLAAVAATRLYCRRILADRQAIESA